MAGVYEPIRITEEPDGVQWGHSPMLGLDLCWEEGQLRVYDPAAGKYLPTPVELQDQRDAAEDRAAAERAARELAEDRAAAEHTARELAETALRRLREQLRRLQAE